jgi:hypothetical protein
MKERRAKFWGEEDGSPPKEEIGRSGACGIPLRYKRRTLPTKEPDPDPREKGGGKGFLELELSGSPALGSFFIHRSTRTQE